MAVRRDISAGESVLMPDSINSIGGRGLNWETIRPGDLYLYLEALRRAVVEKHRLSDYQNTGNVIRQDIPALWKKPFPHLSSIHAILTDTNMSLAYYGDTIFEYLWRKFANHKTADINGGWHNSDICAPAWTRATILDAIEQDDFIYPVQCLSHIESGTYQGYSDIYHPRHPQPLFDWIKQTYKILNLLQWFRRGFGFMDYNQPPRDGKCRYASGSNTQAIWDTASWGPEWWDGPKALSYDDYAYRGCEDMWLPLQWDKGDGVRSAIPIDTYYRISSGSDAYFDDELGVSREHYYKVQSNPLIPTTYDVSAVVGSEHGAAQVVTEFGKIETIPRFFNNNQKYWDTYNFDDLFVVKMNVYGGFQYGNWST